MNARLAKELVNKSRLTAVAFAPETLRRASPKLENRIVERRREMAELAEKNKGLLCVLCVFRGKTAGFSRTF